MKLATLTPPRRIISSDEVSAFDCGVLSLNEWLQKRALKNEGTSSRTYVTCNGKTVVGYYCLSSGAIALQAAPKKLTRNMPDPIPVLVMGRLAVDKSYQNQKLGKALLRDAVKRTIAAGETVGISALLVHALSEDAKRFYLSQGFSASPIQEMTLCLRLVDARVALEITDLS